MPFHCRTRVCLTPQKNRSRKKVGRQQKALDKFFVDFIYIENVPCLCIFGKHGGMAWLHISAYLNGHIPTVSLPTWKCFSTHTLCSSVSLLDNILACVFYPSDSNMDFASAASSEMHISLLVLPVHDRTGSVDRTRLLIDSWAERKRSKISLGDVAEKSCARTDCCRGCKNYSWKIHWLKCREVLLRER